MVIRRHLLCLRVCKMEGCGLVEMKNGTGAGGAAVQRAVTTARLTLLSLRRSVGAEQGAETGGAG